MVKYCTEVNKASEDVEVYPLFTWSIWCSRRIVAYRTTISLLSVESFSIRSVGDCGSVFLIVSYSITSRYPGSY